MSRQIDPPSHLLADGTAVRLPPPDASACAAAFAGAVARHGLLRAAGAGEIQSKEGKQGETNEEDERADTSDRSERQERTVHPLALASAALNLGGISELSRGINLAGLIQSRSGNSHGASAPYFGLTNVIGAGAEREALLGAAAVGEAAAAAVRADNDGSAEGVAAAGSAAGVPPPVLPAGAAPRPEEDELETEAAEVDRHNRSTYLLTTRAAALASAASVLRRHRHRLLLSTTSQNAVDGRYWELRRRWRLVAPEHGVRVAGPVGGAEVVAVDVEVYDRDRTGQRRQGGVGGSNISNKLGRIARRVPRYATVEVGEGYALGEEAAGRLARIQQKEREGREAKRRKLGTDEDAADVPMGDGGAKQAANEEDAEGGSGARAGATADTIAEPYAVADPALGKVDLDFDPERVPLLTLSMSVERTRTGCAEEVVLASIADNGDEDGSSSPSRDAGEDGNGSNGGNGGNGSNLPPKDEPVLSALQHSLFCASLFESMRGELSSAERRASSSSAPTGAGAGGSRAATASSSAGDAAWLAGGTDRTFLPAPTRLDGAAPPGGGLGGTVCVVHCHQGEVKVRLDAEYDLTVRLVEAGTVRRRSAGSSPADGRTAHARDANADDAGDAGRDSGSQSAAYLRTLCRALLLHARSAYHDHRLRTHAKAAAVAAAEAARAQSGLPPGLARRKKDAEEERPLILGGVLALGGKMLVEQKVRQSLRKLSRYVGQQRSSGGGMPHRLVVEWLTLSMFDAKSYFTASVGPAFTVDVCIDAAGMAVTSFGAAGQYKSVRYGTAEQFEMFMHLQLQRLAEVAGQ